MNKIILSIFFVLVVSLYFVHAEQTITGIAPVTATVGIPYAGTLIKQGTPTGTPTYSLVTNPSGMSINPTTGDLTWTPQSSNIGNNNVTVKVGDAVGSRDFGPFVLTVEKHLSVTPDPLSLNNGVPGQSIKGTITVLNRVNELLSLTVIKQNLVGGSKTITADKIIVTPSSFTLEGSQSKSVEITVNVPLGLPAQFYEGQFEIKDNHNNNVFFLVRLNIQSVDKIVVENFDLDTPLIITGQENEDRTGRFVVRNDGSTSITLDELTSFKINNSADFSDGDKTMSITFDIVDAQGSKVLAPGDKANVDVKVNIPNNIELDTYSGSVTITGGTATAQFNLEVRVHPELCEDGPIGNFDITINEPDNGDEFAPGKIMNIEVEVENNDDDDINDVIVEAFLYNIDADDEIERVESKPKDIDEGDSEEFDIDLEIPIEDIDEDDEYILFVKGLEDGNEDEHCGENQITIDIEREKNDVIVSSVTATPSSAEPGNSVDITVTVVNVGSNKEEDVALRIFVPELGWDKTSLLFSLGKGDDEDNDRIERFTFQVPPTVKAGIYSLLATVTFDEGDQKADGFGEITIVEGEVSPVVDVDATLRIQSVSETEDNEFTVGVAVTNEETEERSYTVDVDANWAEQISPQIFTLEGGNTKIVQFVVTAKEDTKTGSYSGSVNLMSRDNDFIIDSESFTIAVTGKEETTGLTGFSVADLFGRNTGTILFVAADVILIIIAIFFIRLIFKSGSKKKKEQPKVTEKVKL